MKTLLEIIDTTGEPDTITQILDNQSNQMETMNQNLPALQEAELSDEQKQLVEGLLSMPNVLQALEQKAQRGCLALSRIQSIESDEQDEAANQMLVKTRKTLEGYTPEGGQPVKGMKEARMDVTRLFDAGKALLMEPEKRLIAEGERVKALRNAYAGKKAEAIRREQERIAREKAVQDEIARVRAALKQSVVDGTFRAINSMNESIRAYVNGMTLSNWEEKLQKFNVQPKLKMEVYTGFFSVPFNSGLIDTGIYDALKAEVLKECPYEKVNAEYVQAAQGNIKMWKDDLPGIKVRLEAIREEELLGNQVQAELKRKELEQQRAQEEKDAQERLSRQQEQASATVKAELDEARLQNEFSAQVQAQAGPELKGVRKDRVAVLDCAPEQVVQVLSKVMYACFTNPKFEGLLKKKKGKVVGPDENGNPVYADWVAELLGFVAKEHKGEIEGVVFRDKVSTIAKA